MCVVEVSESVTCEVGYMVLSDSDYIDWSLCNFLKAL